MKIAELQEHMRNDAIDQCILANNSDRTNPNFLYLLEKNVDGALIIPDSGDPTLIVSQLDATKGRNQVVWRKGKFLDLLKKVSGKPRRIGLDYENMSAGWFARIKKSFRGARFANISDSFSILRSTKTEEEIGKIRKACKISEEVLESCYNNFSKFKSEIEVAKFLRIATIECGCEEAFENIVAVNKNGAIPHHKPDNTLLRNGICVIDYGAKYKGYCADLTRTIIIGRSNYHKAIEENIAIEKELIESVRAGIKAKELFSKANKLLDYKLIHALGHGIGLEVHESPHLGKNSKDMLKEGMTIAVEPARYFANRFGVRTEDDMVITRTGVKLLSKPQGIIRV